MMRFPFCHYNFKINSYIIGAPELHMKNFMLNFCIKADKKAHHNALERKRRDHIKDSFSGLRDCIPALKNEKVSGQ